MELKAQTIIMRSGPCNCGCKGKDPHHRAFYKRTVRDVHDIVAEPRPINVVAEVEGKTQLVPGEYAFIDTQEGLAQLPGGLAKVRLSGVLHVATGKVSLASWSFVEYV